jgi:polyisoprenoid-binding protein YceI
VKKDGGNKMKKLIVGIIALAIAAPSLSAAVWDFDKAHSNIGFTVRHMVITKVQGKFDDFSGTISFDGKDLSAGSVDVSIKTASINTGVANRDNHLKSNDFFAADSFPQLTFKSKKVVPGADGAFKIVGDLTMRGVTKEVTLDATFNGTIKDPMGNSRAGFTASARINRQDWGISWSKTLDSGGLVASNDVDINLDIEAVEHK